MDARLVRYLESIGVGADALDGWTVTLARKDGVDCGYVISRGTEIHIYPFYAGAMSRKNIIEHMAKILDEHGFITTRVPLHETNHKLRELLGFRMLWWDMQYTYWAATSLPFQRKDASCQ